MAGYTTLFLDESGKSSLMDLDQTVFLLAGVLLEDSEIKVVEGFFKYIKRKHGLDPEEPFHSYHAFEHPDERLSAREALQMSVALADFLSLIPVEILVAHTDKREFRKALGAKQDADLKGSSYRKSLREYPYRIMAARIFSWFAGRLEALGKRGQIICDARRGGDHQLLRTLYLCKEGHFPAGNWMIPSQIDRGISSISFVEKGYGSGGLEITDLVSYISFFNLTGALGKTRNKGFQRIWEEIASKARLVSVETPLIQEFFEINKDGVHKYLRRN